MKCLSVILARAGSKGLPDKCVLPLCGRPVLAYTISHAQQSRYVSDIVLTTDSEPAASIAQAFDVDVVIRPPELAGDTARVDDAVRHALQAYEEHNPVSVDAVVILYGNCPIRADGAIDACIEKLMTTDCDSVRTVAPVTKQHPDWVHRLDDDKMVQFRPNSIHRRQDLEPIFYHDSAVIVVSRSSLDAAAGNPDPHAFFGADRRAVLQSPEDAVDIDTLTDLLYAEAVIRVRNEAVFADPPTAGFRQPPFTAAVSCGGSYDRR